MTVSDPMLRAHAQYARSARLHTWKGSMGIAVYCPLTVDIGTLQQNRQTVNATSTAPDVYISVCRLAGNLNLVL